MSETKNPLTDEVKALIGVSAEKVEAMMADDMESLAGVTAK